MWCCSCAQHPRSHGRSQAREASRNQMMLQDKCTNQIVYTELSILNKSPCSPCSPCFCHHIHHVYPTHNIIPHIHYMCPTIPYYSSHSPYISNHTILFLTRFPALNKSHTDGLVSLNCIFVRPNHVRMPNPEFPLRSPYFPNCICYRANELPWAFPPRLELVLECFDFGIPQPHPIACLERLLDAPSPRPMVRFSTLLTCIFLQPPPHYLRTIPQLDGRSKLKRARSLLTLLQRREWGVIVDLDCALDHLGKVLGFFRPHVPQTIQ